jgi:hypothetical protein
MPDRNASDERQNNNLQKCKTACRFGGDKAECDEERGAFLQKSLIMCAPPLFPLIEMIRICDDEVLFLRDACCKEVYEVVDGYQSTGGKTRTEEVHITQPCIF